MVTIDLYKYGGKPYTVNKTLGEPVTIKGEFRKAVSVMLPDVVLRYNGVFDYNYCYIRELNRYYNIASTYIQDTDTWLIRLNIDLLKTYEKEIMGATGTLSESQQADPYLSTRNNIYDVRPHTDRLDFTGGNENGFTENGDMIMVTLRGKTT